jgi:molybdate transport system ATP-binding protein
MIEVRLRVRRGGFVLDVDFASQGRLVALFGRSGAGKTTIVQAIAGGVRPDAGFVRIDGSVLLDTEAGIDVPVERRGIGMVFQDARLFPHMTVSANLRFGLVRARGRSLGIGFDAVVDLLGIGRLLDRRPHALSGGERQRVALGRALLAQPRLLLMDEPLAALDAARKAEILPYVERLRDALAVPIVYVSHAIEEVVRLATDVVLLADGRVLSAGPLAAVMSGADLAPVVGGLDIGTILDCTVVQARDAHGLATLGFADGTLRVPALDLVDGAQVRARIPARDVALALSCPVDVSVTNRLPGAVGAVVPVGGALAKVAVDLGSTRLWALVTAEAVERLALAPGVPVWAMIKAVALDGRSLPH